MRVLQCRRFSAERGPVRDVVFFQEFQRSGSIEGTIIVLFELATRPMPFELWLSEGQSRADSGQK